MNDEGPRWLINTALNIAAAYWCTTYRREYVCIEVSEIYILMAVGI